MNIFDPQAQEHQADSGPIVVGLLARFARGTQDFDWREGTVGSVRFTAVLTVGVVIVSVILFLFVSVFSAIVAVLLVSERPGETLGEFDEETLKTVLHSRLGLALTIVPPQLSLLVAPLIAACFFPGGLKKALLLTPGRWPWWAWAAAAMVAPLVGIVSSVLLGVVQGNSEHLQQLTDTLLHHRENGYLFLLVLLIGVTPAICEEVLFRGFIQPRFTHLCGPGVGIVGTSFAFAIFHLDPVHAITVFPLGLWLGYISYRSQSLYPAILAHLVNNLLSVFLIAGDEAEALDVPNRITIVLIVVFGIAGALALAGQHLRSKKARVGRETISLPQKESVLRH